MFTNLKKKTIIASAIVLAFATGATAATTLAHQDLFTDVPETHTHRTAIHWAADNGIIYGDLGAGATFEDGNTFGPSDYTTRGQLASILKRYHDRFGGSGGGTEGPQGPQGEPGADGKDGKDGKDFECAAPMTLQQITIEDKHGKKWDVLACAVKHEKGEKDKGK